MLKTHTHNRQPIPVPARKPPFFFPGYAPRPDGDGDGDGGGGDGGGAGDGDGGGGDGGGAGDGDGKGKGLSLTQAELDRIVDQAIGRARRGWERDAENKRKNDADKDKDKDKGKGGNDKDVVPRAEFESQRQLWEQETNQKLSEKDKVIASLKGEKLNAAVVSAAAKLDAVNAQQVSRLVADAIAFDEDDEIVVLGTNGQPRYGSGGNYLTVEEFLAEFKKGNGHLFKGSTQPGAGSGNGGTGQGRQSNTPSTPQGKIASGLSQLRK